MAEHSPTPWHFLPGDKSHQATVMAIGEDGFPRLLGGFGMAGSSAATNTANAEFVVRAVNAFDALVEAVKDAAWYLLHLEVRVMSDDDRNYIDWDFEYERMQNLRRRLDTVANEARGDSEVRA